MRIGPKGPIDHLFHTEKKQKEAVFLTLPKKGGAQVDRQEIKIHAGEVENAPLFLQGVAKEVEQLGISLTAFKMTLGLQGKNIPKEALQEVIIQLFTKSIGGIIDEKR